MPELELIQRLVVSVLLGGALGFEREWRKKSAGLRTNILIAMGSSLFTMLSLHMSTSGGDPTRIAAQIVTGIGFLGAGAIMRTGTDIQGLTTAATIWVNAAIGVAVGSGEYRMAVLATAVALGSLIAFDPVERLIDRHHAIKWGRRSTDVVPSGEGAAAPERGAADDQPRSTRR